MIVHFGKMSPILTVKWGNIVSFPLHNNKLLQSNTLECRKIHKATTAWFCFKLVGI